MAEHATATTTDSVRDAAGAAGWEILDRIRSHPDLTGVPVPDPFTGERTPSWDPLSPDNGDLGVALVLAGADEIAPDDGWDRAAFPYVRRAVDALAERAAHGVTGPGLFTGAAGVAHALRALSRGGQRYRNASEVVEDILLDLVDQRLRTAPPPGADGLATDDYDVVTGLAGPARLLLQLPERGERARMAATALVDRLVRWADGGYRTPASQISDVERRGHPDLRGGYLNLGYAHGIAGVLAVLGLARRRGLATDGLDDAVAALATRLRDCALPTPDGPELPFYLPAAPTTGDGPGSHSRTGWCYGNIGACLALAECARTDPAPDRQSATLMAELLVTSTRRPPRPGDENPSLCHGVGGLVAIGRYLAATAGVDDGPWLDDLGARLLRMRDPDTAFGLHNVQGTGHPTDSPGFLTGSGGAAVALVSWSAGTGLTTAEQMICGGDLC